MSGWLAKLEFDPTAPDGSESQSVGAYVRAGTDGDLIGSQTLNAQEWLNVASAIVDSAGNEVGVTSNALDVNIASGSLTITEEDVYNEDTAHTSGDAGGFILAVRNDTLGSLVDTDGDYAPFQVDASGQLYVKDADVLSELQGGITVNATDLDIRDLSASQDNVAISDGTNTLAVDASGNIGITDAGGSLTVDSTDLDIRDLDAAQDSVQSNLFDGAGTALTSTLVGSDQALDVNVVQSDAADVALANSAIAHAQNDVTTTAESLVASALTDRKYLYLFNQGSKILYIGGSGVTAADGFPLYKFNGLELRAGASVDVQGIAESGTIDLRTLELS